MTYDNINPSHYRGDRKFEPIEVIEDWDLNYRLGNAVKYISRNGRKPNEDPREGLKKAIWYLEREIAALDGQQPYSVEYEDVLDYYGQTQDLKEAWPSDFWKEGQFDMYVTGQDGIVGASGKDTVPFDRDAEWAAEWDADWDWDDDFMWDPSLGPIDLSKEEVESILAKKDLEQFQNDEIVSTIERRGLIIGVKRDGSTCLLNDRGRCQ